MVPRMNSDCSSSSSAEETIHTTPRKDSLLIPFINFSQLSSPCPIVPNLDNTPPPVSWRMSSRNISRSTSQEDKKLLTLSNTLKIHLNPLKFHCFPFSKRMLTGTMKMSHREPTLKSQNNLSNMILGNDYETTTASLSSVYNVDRRLVEGKCFSRFLKETSSSGNIGFSATSTPSVPYSSELIGSYNNDTNRLPSSDDLRISNNGANLSERSRSYDTDRRPTSWSRASKSIHSSKKGYDERDRDDRYRDEMVQGQQGSSNPRQNYFKPIGLRNNYLANQSPSSGHINAVSPANINTRNPPPPISTRDTEDLVAMGTNWNPNGSNGQKNGSRPGSYGQNVNPLYQVPQASSGSLQSINSNSRRSGAKTGLSSFINGKPREQEPKYADPTSGACPGLIQRIAEIAALESETIRWEKSRKVKKKVKSDY